MKKCVHVFYSGTVQGVGFRFTAVRIATDLGLKGWVRNLRNGRVEVVAEGEEKELKSFLEKMETGSFKHYIHNRDINWQEPTDEFKDFDIRF